MAGKGGWWKVYDDILDDPKVERLDHLSFRVFIAAMAFCNRSPYRQRERGWLLHSKGFAVDATDFARKLGVTTEEAEQSLEVLCKTGGDSSLIVRDCIDGTDCFRVRAWRKRQDGKPESTQDELDQEPEEYPESTQEVPPIDVKTLDVRRKTKTRQRPAPAVADAPQSCSWCTNPTDPEDTSFPVPQRLMQVYHDAFRARCGECPSNLGRAFGELGKFIKGSNGKSLEEIAAVIRHGVNSVDPFAETKGYSLSWVLGEYQGISLAMKAGHPHGQKPRHAPVVEEYDGRFDYPDEDPR
jgi:hypothetical protein